ncbi:hypothetical protein IEQ34_017124 [Dendrobium chrysotoxum]|uniref:FeS cluster biogenesis domain-containing protein n=1 Tax=Dendrobium chrysotoxum TaxID=161865 RepID=A0AAV7G9E5_DENCH|nr:hypothetical protein IEQ34_017124 [Dendrobium chrysotoxum]
MALAGTGGPLSCRLPLNSRSPAINRPILALPKKASDGCRKKFLYVRFSASSATPTSGSIAPAISLSDKAFNHLNKMRVEKNDDLCLRIGVKQGGCSGMSYTMEFENRANTRFEDSLIEYKGFTIGAEGFGCGHRIFGSLSIAEEDRGSGPSQLYEWVAVCGRKSSCCRASIGRRVGRLNVQGSASEGNFNHSEG